MLRPRPILSVAERAFPDIDLLHFLKQRELVFLDLLIAFLPDNNKVFILFHLFDNAVHIADIFVDLSVDQRHEKRLTYLFHALHDLIVIIDVDQSGDHPLILIFTDIGIELCDVSERNRHDKLLLLRDLK